MRKVINHSDCIFRTELSAKTATDTALFAGVHNVLALAMRRAGYVHFCLCGNTLDNLLGAGVNAHTAGDTNVGIDIRNTVVNGDCVLRAGTETGAEAQTAVVAHLRALEQLSVINASIDTAICVKVYGVQSACALNVRNGRFIVTYFHTEDFGYLLLAFGAGNVAVGQTALTFAQLFRKACATGATATAAVSACKFFNNLL